MKKFIVACLMCLITILSFGQEDMMLHVYRNDSVFNAFYTFEIDSMCCSVVDTMGIEHDGYVVQEIYTADSLYRIPLNAIDSIVFATPKIEYHQDVRVITDSWLDYVVSINELTIILSQDIPSDVIPAKGDVLVAETESAPFERGFAGRVSDVEKRDDSIVVICDDVTLNDIYKTLIYKGTSKSSTDILQGKKQQRAENRNEMGTLYFDIPHNLSMNLGPMSLNVSPTITLDYIICINEDQTYIYNRINHYYDCSVQLDCDLTGEYSPDPDFIFSFDIPNRIPGLYAEVNMGPFFESSGGVVVSMTQPFKVIGTTGYVAYDDCVADIDEWHFEKKDIEFSANLNGEIRCGFATQATLRFISNRLARIDVTAYLGPEIQSNLSLSSEGLLDGSLYTALKGSVVTLNAYGKVVPGWRFYGFEHQKFNYNPSFHFLLNTWYILPEFNNLSWMPSEGTKGGKLSGGINRDLFWPGIQLGWSLYDENDQIYSSQYYPETYRLMREWPYDGMDMNLQELPYGSKYKAYPMIKIFGYEMRALPSVDVSIDEPKAVDLGLSVKWAICNVGANSPEDYGDYFAWGETEPKEEYSWSTYKYCDGSYTTFTKYCTDRNYGKDYFKDYKTELDPEDDAATANWGGVWRMPTLAEQQELIDNCTWTWTKQNGVNGCKVTGPNGNSIFLPAAGYMDEGTLRNAGSFGYYWSSSLDTDFPAHAYFVYFYSGYGGWYYGSRIFGISVRPVCQ